MRLFFFRKPTHQDVAAFLKDQESKPLSYPEVGATRAELPKGYRVDRNSFLLGRGRVRFERAADCLRNWRQFDLPWIRLYSGGRAPAAEVTVALLIRLRFAWTLNSCRVVYTFEESEREIRRFGFAYGTLQAHAESGEERFEAIWDGRDNSVRYNLLAFSRPQHWLARLGKPVARRLQHRFVRDSQLAMREAVSSGERIRG